MRRFLSFLTLLLSAATGSAALANPAVEPSFGPWGGVVGDAKSEREYSLDLMIWRQRPDLVVGVALYPELGCVGHLTLRSAAEVGEATTLVRDARHGEPLWFTESMAPNSAPRCRNGGLIALFPRHDGTLSWRRVLPDGNVTAESGLTRKMPSRDFDQVVRAHVATFGPATVPNVTISMMPTPMGASALPPDPAALAAMIPLDKLRQAALGSFTGTLADCARATTVAMTLRELPEQRLNDALRIGGSIRVVQTVGDGKRRVFDSEVSGLVRTRTGAIAINTFVPNPAAAAAPVVAPKPQSAIGGLFDRVTGRDRKQAAAASAADAARGGEGMPFKWFPMLMARDLAGVRWKGTLNDGLFGCFELDLARTDGQARGLLPMQSLEDVVAAAALGTNFVIEDDAVAVEAKAWPERQMRSALGFSDPGARTAWPHAYWLRLAAEMGDARASAMAGRVYEYGLGVGKDEVRAAELYGRAAALNDPGGLRGAARMMTSGAGGVARNELVARGMVERAAKIEASARQLCGRSGAIERIGRLIDVGSRTASNSLATTMLGALMGQQQRVEVRGFGIERVDVAAVSTPGTSFICRVVGRRIGAQVTDLTPYKRWAHYDQAGNLHFYSDNEADRSWNQAGAEVQTFLLNQQPFVELFEFRRQSNGRWRITLLEHDTFGRLAPKLFVEVVV